MKISLIAEMLNALTKSIPLIQTIAAHLSDQRLSGVWCVCWKNQEDLDMYQLGSMDIKQTFRAVSGNFYSSDRKWPLKAEFRDGVLTGTYETEGSPGGFVRLRFGGDGIDTNRLVGHWAGLVAMRPALGASWETVDQKGAPMRASRREACSYGCHMKKLQSTEECCKTP